jgi:hypothetical protein
VDQDRQPGRAGQTQLAAEGLFLEFLGWLGKQAVEADLAHGRDLGIIEQPLQPLFRFSGPLVSGLGMDSGCGPDSSCGVGQGQKPLPPLRRHTRNQEAADAGGAGRRQRLLQRGEGVQVDMGVEKAGMIVSEHGNTGRLRLRNPFRQHSTVPSVPELLPLV